MVLSLEDLAGVEKPSAASLTLRRGEVLGIAGLIGAGRTELLRAVYGLDAVRSGPWKLHFPHPYSSLVGPAGRDGKPGGLEKAMTELALYNLDDDIGEKHDVSAQHPEVVERLTALAERARADLGDSHTDRKGTGIRGPATLHQQLSHVVVCDCARMNCGQVGQRSLIVSQHDQNRGSVVAI